MARKQTALEQHIAVFGESGSGKTVLLSSFYGATQEPQYSREHLYRLYADDTGVGNRLHQNYLGMKQEAQAPPATRFESTAYSFSIKLKEDSNAKRVRGRPFDAMRLVWHDYPGEWFEQDASGPAEQARRVDGFRSLLGSDVALFLVDGQRLLDYAGEEQRYLKSLLGNFRNSLLSLKGELLRGGEPLIRFPRIWIMALSKSDLLPETDVYAFRDLMIGKVAEEINELREVLSEFVAGSEALAVGEDFLLLSSAKFETGRIDVDTRVGVELMLPLAAMLPFERHVRWARTKQLPGKVAESLVGAGAIGVTALAGALLGNRRLPGPLRLVQGAVGGLVSKEAVDQAARLAGDALKSMNAGAQARHDYLAATLTQFKLDLARGEQERVLLRSPR
ncbi:ATP/GTP-binding protein [Gulosibacter sp. 10]|uniref:TRAFAC clade GTPase domain-containing protein n=1 Tax=Gulosibacter sp. 10 TaxID=1255570 RepID=UPI00097EA914|nr:ATP/GTP-binding protein [Gulosibacter sp. 10]SJM58233.1 hypothetical protein FM112_05755 [Gulosibacter sp. 10]